MYTQRGSMASMTTTCGMEGGGEMDTDGSGAYARRADSRQQADRQQMNR